MREASSRGCSSRSRAARYSDEGAVVDRPDQGVRDRQPGALLVRVHDVGRAQADRADAAPLRTEPRRPVRSAPADRRPRKADPQGELLSDLCHRRALHRRAGARRVHGARGLQRHPLRARLVDLRVSRQRLGRRRPDLADPALRDRLARHLRLHRRRLGERVEVLAPRLDANLRTDGLLRGLARALGPRRDPDGALALARRHRSGPAGDALVRRAPARRLRDLLHRRDRRDEPPPVRPARSRDRARGRLPHGVQRHALRPLLDGRVHQHDHALGARDNALLRRLERPLPPRARLVSPEARRLYVRLRLVARLAPAPALRPADEARLEGAAARRDPECARNGLPGGAPVSAQPLGSLKGFGLTFRQIFRKPITQQYPEYKRPLYPRFRGRHRLWRHENGLEKCIGCSLCAAACPADCIRVVAAENTAENRVSAGERYARIYEINLSRCIFCGYCELACPFDAITLEQEFEISEYSRDDLIYTKDMLLAEPIKRVPVADRELYDTPIPYYKTSS
ncbi:MAG: NADH-quinone oxidoreductase subunit NuoI [Actinobacteria bacterium]|nr:NADH-quinone oxidoreductase subunit NuoI [Actinomycetota bacterium]